MAMRTSLVSQDVFLYENPTIVPQVEGTWMVLVEFIYHHLSLVLLDEAGSPQHVSVSILSQFVCLI